MAEAIIERTDGGGPGGHSDTLRLFTKDGGAKLEATAVAGIPVIGIHLWNNAGHWDEFVMELTHLQRRALIAFLQEMGPKKG